MRVLVLGLWITLAAALHPAAAGEAPPILRAGEAISIELAAGNAPLAGHGPSRTIPYKVQERCFVYIAATSESVDPFLRVSDAAGTLLAEDDNSGGGKAAFVRFPCEGGEALAVEVASAAADAAGAVDVTLHEVPRIPLEDEPKLEALRARLRQATEMQTAGTLDAARAHIAVVIDDLRASARPDTTEEMSNLLWDAGVAAFQAQALAASRDAFAAVLGFRDALLPRDHPDLLAAQFNVASTLFDLGDHHGARVLEEKLLDARTRTLPDDHADLQRARENLAITFSKLGDFPNARRLQEKVLEVRMRTLPDDHADLQRVRIDLAKVMSSSGDRAGARKLREKVLEVYSLTLPEDHADLQNARSDLAVTLREFGDLAGARVLQEKVLEIRTRTLSEDNVLLHSARLNLANTLKELGDLAGARTLQEKALESLTRILPEDHVRLQTARLNLGVTVNLQGDILGARALFEKVFDVYSRTLPDDHRQLQLARRQLAGVMRAMGDIPRARSLGEKALEVYTKTLPDDHGDLQAARLSLAQTMKTSGDLAGASALERKALEILTRTMPDDNWNLQWARGSLASTLSEMGDHASARALQEKALEVWTRILPDDHSDLQRARGNLGNTLFAIGELADACALQRKAVEVLSNTHPDDHASLQTTRVNLAFTLAALGDPGAFEQVFAVGSALMRETSQCALEVAPRESMARAEATHMLSSAIVSLAAGCGTLPPSASLREESVALLEHLRGAGRLTAQLGYLLDGDAAAKELRARAREKSAEIARLAATPGSRDALHAAVRDRDLAHQALVVLLAAKQVNDPTARGASYSGLAERLAPGEAAVSYWGYLRTRFDAGSGTAAAPPIDASAVAPRKTDVQSLLALVIRKDQPLAWVDLGPMEPIESAVEKWRAGFLAAGERGAGPTVAGAKAGIGSDRQAGELVRTLILDPVRAAAGDATRLIVALDDVLHLVPLDALPDGDGVVGDHVQISVRATLWELLAQQPAPSGEPRLLSLGGIDYGAGGDEVVAGAPGASSLAVRSGAWGEGFPPLPEAAAEVRVIGELFAKGFGVDATSHILEEASASKEALMRLAPDARYVHLATHGYFAAEAIASSTDLREASPMTLALGDEHVRGLSPMVLCGLALAGANLPPDALGRISGVITAEEIAALDLSSCNLVVLSACDTNVGLRRAGQGIESLQKAVHMAGARSAITSLWQVGDAATRELMCEFYQRLWIDKKPKAQALWQAKLMLRNAKDDLGRPRYAFGDWAGWVLTGEPD